MPDTVPEETDRPRIWPPPTRRVVLGQAPIKLLGRKTAPAGETKEMDDDDTEGSETETTEGSEEEDTDGLEEEDTDGSEAEVEEALGVDDADGPEVDEAEGSATQTTDPGLGGAASAAPDGKPQSIDR
ncbi:hypothetical protein FRC12_014463 [Ceratobasidium sp. 428]|nr:hypothetical protein FRC12_014463 [Ceratobasidium sp. 428]